MFTMVISALVLQGALQMTPQAMPSPHFEVLAAYEAPAKKGAPASIVFEFKKKDPDVNINEEPAPRIKFAAGSPLVAPPPPKSSGVIPDPANRPALIGDSSRSVWLTQSTSGRISSPSERPKQSSPR